MQTTGSFFSDTRKLIKDYIDLKIRIIQLRATRLLAKVAGNIVWMLVLLFMVFLLCIFIGLTMGFYLSSVTGSYTAGFGLTTLFILLLVLLLVVLRRRLFIDPIVRSVIQSLDDNKDDQSAN